MFFVHLSDPYITRSLILHMRSELGTASPAGLHAIKKRMNSLPLVILTLSFQSLLESTIGTVMRVGYDYLWCPAVITVMALQYQIYCSGSNVTLGMEEHTRQGHTRQGHIRPWWILYLLSYRVLWFEASLAHINFFRGQCMLPSDTDIHIILGLYWYCN